MQIPVTGMEDVAVFTVIIFCNFRALWPGIAVGMHWYNIHFYQSPGDCSVPVVMEFTCCLYSNLGVSNCVVEILTSNRVEKYENERFCLQQLEYISMLHHSCCLVDIPSDIALLPRDAMADTSSTGYEVNRFLRLLQL